MSIETPDIQEQNTKEEEIKLEQVAELEEPIKKIIQKVKERIESGEYGLIIGDDASGRIPARILGGFVREISKTRGFDQPDIIFIPGKLKEGRQPPSLLKKIFGTSGTNTALEERILKHRVSPEKRILIVTDTVMSGESLRVLVKLLQEQGYTCDIAAIGVEEPTSPFVQEQRGRKLNNSEIISGEYEERTNGYFSHTPSIYGAKEISGIYKIEGSIHSIPLRKKSATEKGAAQELIRQSRHDANIVIRRLIDWYQSR